MAILKNLLTALCVSCIAINATGQIELPIRLKDKNLKGNIVSVKHETFRMEENFGEPKKGDYYTYPYIVFYDENGNSILSRNLLDAYSAASILFSYKEEDGCTTVKVNGINNSKKCGSFEYGEVLDNTYEKLLREYKGREGSNDIKCSTKERDEIKYDKNYVKVEHSLYRSKEYEGALMCKYIARPDGNGNYPWTYYDGNGKSLRNGKDVYVNGRLTSHKDNMEGKLGGKPKIYIGPNVTNTYDAKGRLIEEKEQQWWYKYIYNEHGDVLQIMRMFSYNGKSYSKYRTYSDYKYDSNGNWISRLVTHDNDKLPSRMEVRTIVYANSKEELVEKADIVRNEIAPVIMEIQ